MRGGRLRDQPHPPSLLGGAAGVRPPAGTPPLQLRRTLPQIQTPLPVQGLPPRPGGAVQRLSIMTGRARDGRKRIETQIGVEGKGHPRVRTGEMCDKLPDGAERQPKTVNVG